MPHDAWNEWLAAERADMPERADLALREAFSGLARRTPPPDLHARLLQITSPTRGSAHAGRSEGWVAAGLVLAALALTVAPLGIIAGFFLISPGRVVSAAARGCVWLAEWLNAGASVWALLARTGSALGHVAVTPAGSSLLTGSLLIASLGLLMLNRYLPVERSES